MTQNEKTRVHDLMIDLVIDAKHKFIKTQEYQLAANMRLVERYLTAKDENDETKLTEFVLDLERLNII